MAGFVRIEGEAWCDVHCSVHEDTDDPFGYGDVVPECTAADRRPVYYRSRKGDM